MAQQITVSACTKHGLVTLPAPLAQRKRDRDIRMCFLDLFDQTADDLIRKEAVFSALHDDRPIAELISDIGAF